MSFSSGTDSFNHGEGPQAYRADPGVSWGDARTGVTAPPLWHLPPALSLVCDLVGWKQPMLRTFTDSLSTAVV